MQVKLLQADFSANNIGRFYEPSARALTLMAKYSKTFSYSQKVAFSMFLDTLEDNGILVKLDALYIPIMAGDISETFLNMANGGAAMSTTFITSAINNFNSTNFRLDSDGIVQLVAAKTLMCSVFASMNMGDWHYLLYHKAAASSHFGAALYQGTTFNFAYSYISNTGVWNMEQRTLAGENLRTLTGLSSEIFFIGADNNNGMTGFGVKSNSYKVYTGGSGVIGNYDILPAYYETINTVLNANASITYANQIRWNYPVSLISIGKGLSDSEYAIYNAATKNLIAAMSAQ